MARKRKQAKKKAPKTIRSAEEIVEEGCPPGEIIIEAPVIGEESIIESNTFTVVACEEVVEFPVKAPVDGLVIDGSGIGDSNMMLVAEEEVNGVIEETVINSESQDSYLYSDSHLGCEMIVIDETSREEEENSQLCETQNSNDDFESNKLGNYDSESNKLGADDSVNVKLGSDDSESNKLGSDDSESNKLGSDVSESNKLGSDDSESNKLGSDDSESNKLGSDDSQSNKLGSDDSVNIKLGSVDSESNKVDSDDLKNNKVGSDDSGNNKLGSDDSENNKLGSDDSENNKLGSDDSESNKPSDTPSSPSLNNLFANQSVHKKFGKFRCLLDSGEMNESMDSVKSEESTVSGSSEVRSDSVPEQIVEGSVGKVESEFSAEPKVKKVKNKRVRDRSASTDTTESESSNSSESIRRRSPRIRFLEKRRNHDIPRFQADQKCESLLPTPESKDNSSLPEATPAPRTPSPSSSQPICSQPEACSALEATCTKESLQFSPDMFCKDLPSTPTPKNSAEEIASRIFASTSPPRMVTPPPPSYSPSSLSACEHSPAFRPVKVKSRWRRSSELEMGSKSSDSELGTPPLSVSPAVFAPNLENMENKENSAAGINVKEDAKVEKEEKKEEKEACKGKEEVVDKLRTFVSIEENLYLTERKRSKEVKRMVCDCFLTKEEIQRGDKGCGEDCLNRLLMIECGSRCPLSDRCTNRRFQRRDYCKCEVFKTGKKGFGLRALEDIPVGGFLLEYVGEVLDPKEFRRRAKDYAREKNAHYYFMALKSDAIIDATQKGNNSRFINHSCDPNAETQKWTVNGELRIGFFSKRSINAGDEITFDYQLQRYGKEAQRCFCETSACRGWIGKDPEKEEDRERKDKKERKDKEVSLVKKKEKKKEILKEFLEDMDPQVSSSEQSSSDPSPPLSKQRPIWKKSQCLSTRSRTRRNRSLEEEIEKLCSSGLKNRNHTLTLCRLMVRAEDRAARRTLLGLLRNGDQPCRRLFLDYHGLRLVWSWMVDVESAPDSLELKLEILKTLSSLPVPNKTMLQDSKVLGVVERWSSQLLMSNMNSNVEGEQVEGRSESLETTSDAMVTAENGEKQRKRITTDTSRSSTEEDSDSIAESIKQEVNCGPCDSTEDKQNGDLDRENKIEVENETIKEQNEDNSDSPANNQEVESIPPVNDKEETETSMEVDTKDCEEECKIDIEIKTEVSMETKDSESKSKEMSEVEQPMEVVETALREKEAKIRDNEKEDKRPEETVNNEKINREASQLDSVDRSEEKNKEAKDVYEELRKEVCDLVVKLLDTWSSLKEVFRIPKKERIEQMKEHEREADRGYKEYLDREHRHESRNHYDRFGRSDRYRSEYDRRDRKRKVDSPDRERDRDRERTRKTPRLDERILVQLPRMSKEERRQLFALRVAQEEEEERQRRQQEEIWHQHEERCQLMNLDPHQTPMFDPSFLYYFDPNTGTWQTYTPALEHISMQPPPPPPPSYDAAGYEIPPESVGISEFLTGMYEVAPPLPPECPPVPEEQCYDYNEVPMIAVEDIPLPSDSPMPPPFPATNLASPLIPLAGAGITTPEIDATASPVQPIVVPVESETIIPLDAIAHIPLPPEPETLPVSPVKLPPKWKTAKDSEGRVYYYHVKWRQPQWEPPAWEGEGEEGEGESEEEESEEEEDEEDEEDEEEEGAGDEEGVEKEEEKEDEEEDEEKNNLSSPEEEEGEDLMLKEAEKCDQEEMEAEDLDADTSDPYPGVDLDAERDSEEEEGMDEDEELEEGEIRDGLAKKRLLQKEDGRKEGEEEASREEGKLPKRREERHERRKRRKRAGLVQERIISPRREQDKEDIKKFREIKEKLKKRMEQSKRERVREKRDRERRLKREKEKEKREREKEKREKEKEQHDDEGQESQENSQKESAEEPAAEEHPREKSTKDKPAKERRKEERHSRRKGSEEKEERREEKSEKPTSAAADTSSDSARKIKDTFRIKMASWIVQCLNPYRKQDCKMGRITSTEDFKHLARKLTHFVMLKEMKHCRKIEDLECNDSVKHKARDFIRKYMTKFGDKYQRSPERDDPREDGF